MKDTAFLRDFDFPKKRIHMVKEEVGDVGRYMSLSYYRSPNLCCLLERFSDCGRVLKLLPFQMFEDSTTSGTSGITLSFSCGKRLQQVSFLYH